MTGVQTCALPISQLQARTDKALYKLGVISGLTYSDSQGKADALTTRQKLQEDEVSINQKALETQLAVQKAKVEQAQALAALKQREVDALTVRAGIHLSSRPATRRLYSRHEVIERAMSIGRDRYVEQHASCAACAA